MIIIHLDLNITSLFTYSIDVKIIVGSDRVLLLIFLTEIKFTPFFFDACDVKTLFAEDTVKLTILLATEIKLVPAGLLLNEFFDVLFQD